LIAMIAACGDGDPTMMTIDAPAPSDAAPDAGAPGRLVAYISGYNPNIAWYDVDLATGALAPISSVVSFRTSPSFLALTGTHLYAAAESGSRIGAYTIDRATGGLTFINDVASGGTGPAHVSIDATGKFVMVANYTSGSVAVMPVRSDGGLDAATQNPSPGGQAHQILATPTNRHVLVPCKAADYVAQYTFDPLTGALAPNTPARMMTAAGAGPRHIAFAPDGMHAYLVNELGSTLVAYSFAPSTGLLTSLQTVSTRASGATGTNTGAEIAVHPSGKFVYSSNRGDNNIAVFTINATTGMVTPVGHTPTGGMTPRMFAIEPTGTWMYVANQSSDNVITFAIDSATGALTQSGAPLAVTGPSYVGFIALDPR
jgi:6-phosphogluconolactonase